MATPKPPSAFLGVIAFEEGQVQRLQRDLLQVATGLEAEIRAYALKFTLVGGRFVGNPENLGRLVDMRRQVDQLLAQSGYTEATASFIAGYPELSQRVTDAWAASGLPPGLKTIDAQALASISGAHFQAFANIGTAGTDAVKRALLLGVTGGQEFRQFAGTLRDILIGEPGLVDRAGKGMFRHAATLARTSVSEMHATMADRLAQQAEIETFRYYGPLVKTSRAFCIDMIAKADAGKLWTRDEIAKLDNRQTGPGTCMIARGGFNCNHQWLPVLVAGAPGSLADFAEPVTAGASTTESATTMDAHLQKGLELQAAMDAARARYMAAAGGDAAAFNGKNLYQLLSDYEKAVTAAFAHDVPQLAKAKTLVEKAVLRLKANGDKLVAQLMEKKAASATAANAAKTKYLEALKLPPGMAATKAQNVALAELRQALYDGAVLGGAAPDAASAVADAAAKGVVLSGAAQDAVAVGVKSAALSPQAALGLVEKARADYLRAVAAGQPESTVYGLGADYKTALTRYHLLVGATDSQAENMAFAGFHHLQQITVPSGQLTDEAIAKIVSKARDLAPEGTKLALGPAGPNVDAHIADQVAANKAAREAARVRRKLSWTQPAEPTRTWSHQPSYDDWTRALEERVRQLHPEFTDQQVTETMSGVRETISEFTRSSSKGIRKFQNGVQLPTPGQTAEAAAQADHLERYVKGMPGWDGSAQGDFIYRGEHWDKAATREGMLEHLAQLKRDGKPFELPYVSSFSSERQAALEFGRDLRYVIEGKTSAVPIDSVSANSGEFEVLALQGTKYEVLGTTTLPGGQLLVRLREIFRAP